MSYDWAALGAVAGEVEGGGGTTDEVFDSLRQAGASPLASMKVLHDLRGIRLGEAKRIVWGSPIWADHLPAQERLEADVAEAFDTASGQGTFADTE